MIIRTPHTIERFFYAAINPRARVRDEAAALSIGRAYVGIYPTHKGFEIAWGILDAQGSL